MAFLLKSPKSDHVIKGGVKIKKKDKVDVMSLFELRHDKVVRVYLKGLWLIIVDI